eukprot:NODE_4836_length_754_cov_44.449645_g4484_i0.p1 GENE.NODE_4836_length_754_cov_44.449645_g4484_i0~~NODE_4836_length_754_cov_44.449645_g4484_i0.p1  ORF type:complete len:124 (+),score=17.24 NODE_4836_length_754_cov_44.449645_g4484_i0:136-507(+)
MTEYTEMVGIYNAEGSVWGEVKYAIGKITGSAHCSLCDITHSGISKKPTFVSCIQRLPIPFAAVHLDERSPDYLQLTEGRTPCVVGKRKCDGVWEMVLSSTELDVCQKSVDCFEAALASKMSH